MQEANEDHTLRRNSIVGRIWAVAALAALLALALTAAPALAAPEWAITMTHANAYGQQVGECPGGKASYVPGEPEQDCGVDPFSGSGTSLDRGSGDNAYTINVKNTAGPSPGLGAGATLPCETGTWEYSPSFSYRWLRNGIPISGAEAAEYILTTADEGKVIQCEVIGTNGAGSVIAASGAVTVSPAPSREPPVLNTEVHVPGESGTGAEAITVGSTQTCTPGEWSGGPTFAYQWLRNGAPIAGAESATYEVVEADKEMSLQCEVIATNAGGSVAAENRYFTMVSPSSGEPPYVPAAGPSISVPAPANETRGTVTVADQLPPGLMLAPPKTEEAGSRVSGSGWTCVAPTPAAFTCSRSDGLAPESAYPPITAFVHADSSAPAALINAGTVAGGGALQAVTAYDATAIATVPFGIDSFTTSVSESLGNPFTQAGGHPFAATSTFVLNYIPSNEGVAPAEPGSITREGLTGAGGDASLKDGEEDLPPGFVGDPFNAERCTTPNVLVLCPAGSIVGYATASLGGNIVAGRAQPFSLNPGQPPETFPVWSLAPQPGHAAEFGFMVFGGVPVVLEASVRSDGNYGITIGDKYVGRNGPSPVGLSVTLCTNGATGTIVNKHFVGAACASTPQAGFTGPFLSMPTQCAGSPPVSTLRADSWVDPSAYVSKTVYNGTKLVAGAASASESFVTGCDLLQFAPEVELKPSKASEGGTTQADEPTGATFTLKVPQTNEVAVNATPELKDATVTLPAGMSVDPSAADGLQACSNAQFGLGSKTEPAEPAECPLASKVGTVKVVTPLLEKPLEGEVFIGQPECSPCSNADAEAGHIFRLFLQVYSKERGVVVKLAGRVSANPVTGRLQATFTQQPQLPFSELQLSIRGGARAPLANPQSCGSFTTTTDLTPWSAPGVGGLSGEEAIAGTPDATPSSSFNVDWNGEGGACPASLPFSPSFTAGSQTPTAGASSPFSVTLGREDREQDISAISVTTPPGLVGMVSQVPRCPEAQANAGTCGAESQIGTTTTGAGPGPHPFFLGGRVYLTGPYKNQPFGLSIVVPAIAGPFNLGNVVVRAAISVDPHTAQITVASDPLPQYVDGVQLRLRKIDVQIDRPGFMLNPTSCAQQHVTGTISAAQGASLAVSSPFEVGGCQSLAFKPGFSALTHAKHTRANGESLHVVVSSGSGQANIARVHVELPKALPSRVSTLKLACTEAQFAANPAGCPEGSFVGTATAYTPVLSSPLTGPAIFVSHGGAAFPDLDLVLQGEGVSVILTGNTFIDEKTGVTSSTFASVPDVPVTRFDLVLPTGPHSALAANGNLCSRTVITRKRVRVRVHGHFLRRHGHFVYRTRKVRRSVGVKLTMPTTITGQNGAVVKQNIVIAVSGCPALKGKAKAAKHGTRHGPGTKPKKSSHAKGRK